MNKSPKRGLCFISPDGGSCVHDFCAAYRLQITGHIADPGWRLLLFKDDAKTVHAIFFQGFPDKDHQFHCQEAKRMAMNYGIESGVKIAMETFENEPFPFRPADFPCAQLGFSAKHHRWEVEKSILFYAGPLAIFCATPQVDREIRSKYILQKHDADQRGAQKLYGTFEAHYENVLNACSCASLQSTGGKEDSTSEHNTLENHIQNGGVEEYKEPSDVTAVRPWKMLAAEPTEAQRTDAEQKDAQRTGGQRTTNTKAKARMGNADTRAANKGPATAKTKATPGWARPIRWQPIRGPRRLPRSRRRSPCP